MFTERGYIVLRWRLVRRDGAGTWTVESTGDRPP